MRLLWIALLSPVLWVGLVAALVFSAFLAALSTIATNAEASALGIVAWFIPNPQYYEQPLVKAAVTVFVTGFLGSVLKVILDVHRLEKEGRVERLRFLQNTLDEVKAVEARLQRTRVVILANRSVKTYGNEMRDLIEARVKILNIERAYRLTPFYFPEPFKDGVRLLAFKMIVAFNVLINEFQKNYKPLSDLQRIHEKNIDDASDMADAKNRATERDSVIWNELRKLPELRKFLPHHQDKKESESYRRLFGRHVEALTKELRTMMKATLEGWES